MAELDLPQSGITTLETYMPWPNLEAAKEDQILNKIQAESYQAQLYLRNHLNNIHQKVYGVVNGKAIEEGTFDVLNFGFGIRPINKHLRVQIINYQSGMRRATSQ